MAFDAVDGRKRATYRRSPLTEYSASREGDVPTASSRFPTSESTELQAGEWAIYEVEFRLRELAGGFPDSFWDYLDCQSYSPS